MKKQSSKKQPAETAPETKAPIEPQPAGKATWRFGNDPWSITSTFRVAPQPIIAHANNMQLGQLAEASCEMVRRERAGEDARANEQRVIEIARVIGADLLAQYDEQKRNFAQLAKSASGTWVAEAK